MKKSLFFAIALMGAMVFTACSSDSQTPAGDTTKLWPAGKNGSELFGYIDKSGNLEIPAKYETALGFSCGWALVSEDNEPVFIDKSVKNKKSVDQSELTDYYFYYNHIRFKDGKFKGMWDKDFATVIPADYEYLGMPTADKLVAFAEDLNDDEGCGYLDFNGKVVIEPQWYDAYAFVDGMAVVVEKKGSGSDVSYKYGIIDKKGNYLIEPQKNGLMSMGENRIGMQKTSGKFVMCDKNLEEISGSYDNGSSLSCGMARVYKSEKGYGFVDKNGQEIIPCKYYRAWAFTDDLTFVKKDADSKWEVLDKSGNSVLKLKEDEAPEDGFHNGLALVYSMDSETYEMTYRYIDKSGNTVYKWTPGDEEEEVAPYNWEEKDLRSVLKTEAGVLFLNAEKNKAIR